MATWLWKALSLGENHPFSFIYWMNTVWNNPVYLKNHKGIFVPQYCSFNFEIRFTLYWFGNSHSLGVYKKTSLVSITSSPLYCTTSCQLEFFPKYSTRCTWYRKLGFPDNGKRMLRTWAQYSWIPSQCFLHLTKWWYSTAGLAWSYFRQGSFSLRASYRCYRISNVCA